MNKKLVALAVAGAFTLPLAAEAQTANVTLYGRANLDLEFINGSTCAAPPCAAGTTSNPTVARLSSNSSRFGMRGTESLGGGLSAIFQLESNVSWDSGNNCGSSIASRETFAGLQGSWGKVTAGKFLTAVDDMHPIFGNAPTLTTSILSTADVWAMGNLSVGQGGFDARPGNNVRYDSPNIQGFTAALQYSLRDSSGNTFQTPFGGDNGDHTSELRHAYALSGNVIYSNGPLQAGAAFQSNNKIRQYVAGANSLNANDLEFTVTGAYDFGTIMQGFGLRLGAVYEHIKFDTPCNATITAGTCDLKRDFWGVSATVPVGGGKVYAFYGQAGNGKGSAPDGTTVGYVVHGADTGTKQWEISYSYNLSPRTLVYAGYVKLLNDTYNPTTFNINSYAIQTCTYGATNCAAGRPGGAVFGFVHLF